ncbi:hypothetical protein SLA2020_075780 [Shorea laevis]
MGKLVEGKALENSCRDMGIFELDEKVCAFSDHVSDSSDRSYHNNSASDELCDFADENENDPRESMERTVFWESNEALLQEILERYTVTNVRLRQGIDRIIEQVKDTDFCCCREPRSDGCINCLRKTVVNLLCQKGYNAKLCVSKWKHTKKIPGGMHEYIQVIAYTQGRKKQIPLLIELEFRDQFEIAKACDEYRKLVNQLPEYYVGKADCLNAIVRVLCEAAKQSMKEKKLHRGPWRKRSFMQMKWSSCLERTSVDDSSDDKFSIMFPSQAHGSCLHLSAAAAVVVT